MSLGHNSVTIHSHPTYTNLTTMPQPSNKPCQHHMMEDSRIYLIQRSFHCLPSHHVHTPTHTIINTDSTFVCHPQVKSSELRPWLQLNPTLTTNITNSMASTSHHSCSDTTRYELNPYSYSTQSAQNSHHNEAKVPSQPSASA